jgi:hypothetical protein
MPNWFATSNFPLFALQQSRATENARNMAIAVVICQYL